MQKSPVESSPALTDLDSKPQKQVLVGYLVARPRADYSHACWDLRCYLTLDTRGCDNSEKPSGQSWDHITMEFG